MLTSTNRSRGFPAIINSQIASNLDNWQIVFLTNQSLHSNPTHLTRCMAHSSISHLCLDGTYCLPQHLSMGLGMFHLEKEKLRLIIGRELESWQVNCHKQTSSSASSWRDFWKWVTRLPFCISNSACAVLERPSNIVQTSCCLSWLKLGQ